MKAEVALFILSLLVVGSSCQNNRSTSDKATTEAYQNQSDFQEVLKKHLDAVSSRDLVTLKSTMSPEGKMQLILPGSEIITSVDSFIDYHEEWFSDTTWTFETRVLSTDIGDDMGIAVIEAMYREPERNGKPYSNRMIVSYGLEKCNDIWYIIKDHASSVEKSTDKKQ